MARPASAPAGTARRLGAPDAKNRTVLLDAAEQLMRDEGYAAVTSRRVDEQAGLKPQLVHYYFRTMDDLFLELFRRRADQMLHYHHLALNSSQPLWALWELNTDAAGTAMTMEFIALANHRKTLRAEIARYAELFRTAIGPVRADVALPVVRQPGSSGYGLYVGIDQAF